MCHPLKNDLPTNRLHLVDDIATRMVTRDPLHKINETREARFRLNPVNSDTWSNGRYVGTLLDELMEEIPGNDNYLGYLNDEAFGIPALDPTTKKKLNTAYYHHLNEYDTRDGMGMTIRHRGYADETVFMAMTSQKKVAGMTFNNCLNDWEHYPGCDQYNQSWSYAFPMEIVYLTPLTKWNPYNIEFYGWAAEERAKRVTANDRDGSYDKPYDGSNSKFFYRTPAEFYEEDEYSVRPADTTGSDVWVLSRDGAKHKVRASGHRTFIPAIPGVGRVRQRYPIMPIHGECSTAWKELDALKDIVLNPTKYKNMFYENGDDEEDGKPYFLRIKLQPARAQFGGHTHELELNQADHELLMSGGVVQKISTYASGHQHEISLILEKHVVGHRLMAISCDRKPDCWDGHGKSFREGFSNEGDFVTDIDKYEPTEPTPTNESPTSNCDIHIPNVLLVILITVAPFLLLA